ncbi:MAG TPA: Gldg family protein [Phycisphaerae bacterium]|nr:Gldg family protein [Phycisphaerae bacterium]
MTATRRRLLYGANVAVAAVLVVAVVGIAVWLAGQYGGRADLTSSRVNSLSSRTVGLLGGLDQDITITGLYTVLSEYQQYAQKRQDHVRDLLDLYESFGRGRVATAMIDPMKEQDKVAALLKRLREKPAYKDEAAPHEEALNRFPDLNTAISGLADGDLAQFKSFADADARMKRVREFIIVANNLALLGREAQSVAADVEELLAGDVPRYGKAVSAVREYLAQVQTYLQDAQGWMSGSGAALPDLMPDVQAFFQTAQERYQPVLDQVAALLKETEDLKQVKLEEVYDTLSQWGTQPPILVETETEARVCSLNDVWPYRAGGGPAPPDGDPRDFAGEQAVSSAILQLTQTEKTAVVFTRFGGESPIRPDFSRMNRMMMDIPRAPYQVLNAQLEKANFVTEDWDVATQNEPPDVEDAGHTIYVVFTPEPPPQPNPMQPSPQAGITPAQKQAILDAVNESGLAVFLAGWSQPTVRFMRTGPPYEYADYLRSTWGVELRDQHLALHFSETPQRQGVKGPANRNPLILDTKAMRFTDHDITRPLRALEGAFLAAAPLQILTGDEKPAGVEVAVIAEVRETEDVWAVADILRLQEDLQKRFGTTRHEGDIAAPFPVAVAATNERGQKVVVFGSERFAADDVAQSQSIMLTSKGLQAYLNYPANTDLFVNALHWLTGEADRIAVGPRQSDVPRLDKLTEGGMAQFCRVLLVGIWPGLALLAGAGVWLLRRR